MLVQIDHIVPLLDAWETGAQQWDVVKRTQFANDPVELLAVSGKANRKKKASDVATWLPSNKNYRCEYVTKVVKIKAKYGLWMVQSEHDEASRVLKTCSSQAFSSSGIPASSGVLPSVGTRFHRRQLTIVPAKGAACCRRFVWASAQWSLSARSGRHHQPTRRCSAVRVTTRPPPAIAYTVRYVPHTTAGCHRAVRGRLLYVQLRTLGREHMPRPSGRGEDILTPGRLARRGTAATFTARATWELSSPDCGWWRRYAARLGIGRPAAVD